MIRPIQQSPSPRVLLVEDSLVNLRLLVGLLNKLAFEVTTAGNGQEAVDTTGREEFDVVLMDVQMPIMDGLTAARIIREREAGTVKHTPILAVTAGVDRQSCIDAGMDDYLPKPVRMESLHDKLEHVLRQRRLRDIGVDREAG